MIHEIVRKGKGKPRKRTLWIVIKSVLSQIWGNKQKFPYRLEMTIKRPSRWHRRSCGSEWRWGWGWWWWCWKPLVPTNNNKTNVGSFVCFVYKAIFCWFIFPCFLYLILGQKLYLKETGKNMQQLLLWHGYLFIKQSLFFMIINWINFIFQFPKIWKHFI